jgi:hypothetical protein
MRFAELNKRAEVRDKYRTCDMTINIRTHFARLPGAQVPSSVWSRLRDFGINLLPHQPGGFKYRAVSRLFAIKLTNSRIEQRDYVVHPLAWPCRGDLRDSLRLSEVSLHKPTPHISPGVDVLGLLTTCEFDLWAESISFWLAALSLRLDLAKALLGAATEARGAMRCARSAPIRAFTPVGRDS